MTTPDPARHQGDHRLLTLSGPAQVVLRRLDGDALREEADRLAAARRSAEGRMIAAYEDEQHRARIRAEMRSAARQKGVLR